MRKHPFILTLALALTAAACADAAAPTRAEPGTAVPTLTIMEDTTTPRMSLSMYGQNKVITAADIKYRVIPGSGSGQYTYYWFLERCFTSSSCNPEITHAINNKGAADTVAVRFDANIDHMYITVQVQDRNWPYATGSVTRFVIGPAAFAAAGTSSGFCGSNDVNTFPFAGTTGFYYRDGCSGSRIWSQERWRNVPLQ